MNEYELVIIVNTKTTKEEREEILNALKNYISNKGKVLEVEDMGEKRLAYPIRKQEKGIYYLITFNEISNEISGLERLCRIAEGILKFIVVKKDV